MVDHTIKDVDKGTDHGQVMETNIRTDETEKVALMEKGETTIKVGNHTMLMSKIEMVHLILGEALIKMMSIPNHDTIETDTVTTVWGFIRDQVRNMKNSESPSTLFQ